MYQVITRKRLLCIIVVILASVAVGIWFFQRPKTLDDVNLYAIIDATDEIKHRESDKYCQDYLAAFPSVTKQNHWLNLGILPVDNQLREETVINGCIKASIAVYSDSLTADLAFHKIYQANRSIEALDVSIIDETTVMFATVYSFDFIFPDLDYDVLTGSGTNVENRFLLTKKCNTVVTLFAFVRDDEVSSGTDFGMTLNDEEILAYAKQIRTRIENTLCPILGYS